eukprot:593689-Amphidinium_carterae.1
MAPSVPARISKGGCPTFIVLAGSFAQIVEMGVKEPECFVVHWVESGRLARARNAWSSSRR